MHRYILIALSAPLVAAAPQPVVRAAIASTQPIIVGQAVRLEVTVLAPNYFTGAPEFPQLKIENAIVTLSDETPRHSNETIAGQAFTGIGVTYLVYPEEPGAFKLPQAEVVVKFAFDPPKSVEARIPLPAVRFDATIPPQAAGLDYFLPADSVDIAQTFDKKLNNLKVGDAFTRKVTITCSKLRAMLIPPTKFAVPDSIAVYPKQPELDDIKTSRGELLAGKRTDTATYVIREEGRFTLPAIQVKWWNLAAGRVQTAALPPISLTAAADPNYQPELAPEVEPTAAPAAAGSNPFQRNRPIAEIAAISVTLLALLLVVRVRLAERLRRRWRESRRSRIESESTCFAQLRKASRKGRAREAYSLLLAWLNRFKPNIGLDRFLTEAHDAELTQQVEALASGLYSRSASAPWSGGRMIAVLRRVRSNQRRVQHSRPALPALNPPAG
jgi:GGDEF domain-containing protein